MSDAPLSFNGGLAGALAPFLLFVAGATYLGLAGAPDERGMWPVLLAAIALGLVLCRDREQFSRTLIDGMSQSIVLLMVMAWLLAGVFGSVLTASGLVEALATLAQAAGLSGGGYAAAVFLVCCLFSAATGTSLGTMILCFPLLYPAGAALGTDPVFLAGAIIAGATFGDNISPVSDTTIASASTQAADLGGVVRSRVRYAAPAALVALVAFAILGGGGEPARTASAAAAWQPALAMLAAPALVIALLLRRRHLVEGLVAGIAAALAIGLALRLIAPADVMTIDPSAFGARGLIVAGMERGIGISVFTLLLMGLVATLEASGLVDRLIATAERSTRTARGAEGWIFVAVSGAVLLTTHSTVAILATGTFARQTGRRFGVHRYRRANILDTTVCTYPFLLPWFIPTILASALTADAGAMPRLGALSIGMANIHSWGLLAMVLLAVLAGYGTAKEEPQRSITA